MSERPPSPFPWLLIAIFAVLYTLWPLLGLPAPLYLPETHQVVWSAPPGSITMGWYGRLLMTLVISLPLAAVVTPLVRPSRHAGRWGVWLAAAIALTALSVIAMEEMIHWVLRA